MQYLSLREIIDANRRALLDGTLAAASGAKVCQYTYDGEKYRCAVGLVLTPETVEEIAGRGIQGDSIRELRNRSIVATDPTEFPYINALQKLHDAWTVDTRLNPPLVDLVQGEIRGWLAARKGDEISEVYPAFLDWLEQFCVPRP